MDHVTGTGSLESLRASTLAAGIRLTRRRRRYRRLFSSVPAVGFAVLVLVYANRAPPSAAPVAAASPPIESNAAVKIIDDRQLLDLFRNRTPALIGTPGAQRLVLGD